MSARVWQARLAYGVRRAGWPGWLGVAALAGFALFGVLEVLPAQQRLQGQGARLDAAQTRLTQQGADKSGMALTPTQKLAAFYTEFPASEEVPDILSQVYAIATEQQLALELGEYSLNKVQGARLDQLRITLPLKGAYPQVRRFMAEVLVQHPFMALQNVSLRREKVGEDAVTGRIVFVLFLEHEL